MAYELLPNSGDTLGGTRDQIRQNFSLIKSAFDKNHVNLSANNGKHKWVEMPNQGAIPTGLVASEGTLYVKNANTTSQLFYTNENSTNEYLLTRCDNGNFGTFANNTTYLAAHTGGWTFLPGRAATGAMLLQYGTYSVSAGSGTITFPFPFTTGSYSVTTSLSGNVSTRDVSISTLTNTTFSFSISGTGGFSGNIRWMAIGV